MDAPYPAVRPATADHHEAAAEALALAFADDPAWSHLLPGSDSCVGDRGRQRRRGLGAAGTLAGAGPADDAADQAVGGRLRPTPAAGH